MSLARSNNEEDASPQENKEASRGVTLQRGAYAILPGLAKAPTTGAFCMLVM